MNKVINIKIMFVCWGNICRSPMAEYIFKSINKDCIIKSSAISSEEEGNDIYPKAKKTLDKYNIKYDIHPAHKITKEEYESFDYIICMEKNHVDRLFSMYGIRENVETLQDYDIEDPWYTNNFDKVYNEIYEGCIKLNNKIKK